MAVCAALLVELSVEGGEEHVGTDHLGNKYYYIAQYKNWRGESEERLRVGAPPGPVPVTAIRGRASSVPAFIPGVRGLGRCLG